jgi:hypothetical protein
MHSANGTNTFCFGTGAGTYTNGTATIPLNTWTHLAVSNDATSKRMYVNGTLVNTYSADNISSDGSLNLTINQNTGGGYGGINYMSNLRIVKGTALYTSNFTPSTTPLTAISGTSLLTCQSNRFIDNSANNFAITATGAPSVQRFSPFSPSSAYSTSVIGGSGYFDGSGDYLDIASAASLTPSGDFTIEFWAYPTDSTGTREWYSKGNGIQIYMQSGNWGIAFSSDNSSSYFINISNVGTVIANQWQHIVATRSGNSYVGFVNGVATSLGTSASAPNTGSSVLRIGSFSLTGTYPVIGYMAGVRFVNGTALYGTSNFTPPTAPPTAVTNTQLLCNMTNGAIFDNAMLNDLETVSTAQISTSIVKYGTGSMSFNGSSWLTAPIDANQNFNFGTGDFTVECWFYANSLSASTYACLMGCNNNGTTSEWGAYVRSNGVFFYGSAGNLTGGGTVNTSTWYHFAASRSGSTIRVFLNGTQQASATVSGSYTNSSVGFKVGADNPVTTNPAFNGYIDDVRITKGYARYTANFTPPTQAFPNQ